MKSRLPRFFGTESGRPTWSVAVLLLFVAIGLWRTWRSPGDDLSASYLGCRLLASGHAADLFAYDAANFSKVGANDAWQDAQDAGSFKGALHPYVQTPLWAYGLRPLCQRTTFTGFNRIFAVFILLAFAGVLWLTVRYWTPALRNPFALAVILVLFWFSEPMRYSLFLMQTHVLFLLLGIASLILAERDRPVAAGLLLALAAAVKLTPAFLVLYWILTRRWKAAFSMAGFSILLFLLAYLATGPQLMATYLADIHRISRVLLVSQNNQSFASWAMGRFYDPDEAFDLQIFPLPAAIRIGSTALMVLCVFAGGMIDRWREQAGTVPPPLGAMIALIAATVFAPIAWTHYSIVLLVPVLLLLDEYRLSRSRWLLAAILVLCALNYQPIATDVIDGDIARYALLRSHFYAAILALATLAAVALRRTGVNALWTFRPAKHTAALVILS